MAQHVARVAAHEEQAPTVLVGNGRIGKALGRMLGADLVELVGRGDPIRSECQGPIYVCTTNDALEEVVARTPPARRADLVLFQNGWLLPLLERHRLEQATLVALYMAAGPDGAVRDGSRTAASGRWAAHVANTLARGGVSCAVVQGPELMYVALAEKMLWACIFWMMSAGLGGMPVGEIAERHSSEVQALVEELLPLLQAQLRRSSRPGARAAAEALQPERVLRSLLQYSGSIAQVVPSRDMALAEFAWRNGALLEGERTPLHAAWLERALPRQAG